MEALILSFQTGHPLLHAFRISTPLPASGLAFFSSLLIFIAAGVLRYIAAGVCFLEMLVFRMLDAQDAGAMLTVRVAAMVMVELAVVQVLEGAWLEHDPGAVVVHNFEIEYGDFL